MTPAVPSGYGHGPLPPHWQPPHPPRTRRAIVAAVLALLALGFVVFFLLLVQHGRTSTERSPDPATDAGSSSAGSQGGPP